MQATLPGEIACLKNNKDTDANLHWELLIMALNKTIVRL